MRFRCKIYFSRFRIFFFFSFANTAASSRRSANSSSSIWLYQLKRNLNPLKRVKYVAIIHLSPKLTSKFIQKLRAHSNPNHVRKTFRRKQNVSILMSECVAQHRCVKCQLCGRIANGWQLLSATNATTHRCFRLLLFLFKEINKIKWRAKDKQFYFIEPFFPVLFFRLLKSFNI